MLRKDLFLIIAMICFSIAPGLAQSSSTDTVEKGQSYFEVNLWTSPQSHQNGGMQVYGGRYAYGLTKKTEVGIGFSFSNPHDPEYPPEVQPNFKYKVYENEKHALKVSAGVTGFIPVAKRAGTDGFAMIYANVSKGVAKMKGARFTAGSYALLGRNKDFGSRKGLNLMYEQPINNKVSFSTQWMTGNNRFGYVTSGFSLSLTKKSSLYLGYSVGNYYYDNHGPYISYGFYR